MPKRCVFGCPYNISYHKFPHPEKNPDHFKAWVQIAGGSLNSQADYELYKKKVVCDIHFTDGDKNRHNRLNFLAVPTLHIPETFVKAGTSEKILLVPEPANEDTLCHASLEKNVTDTFVEAGSSKNMFTVLEPTSGDTLCHASLEKNITDRFENVHSLEKLTLPPLLDHEEACCATSKQTVTDKAGITTSEHNYCRLPKTIRKEKKDKQQQPEMPSILLQQLKTSRSKIKILQASLRRAQKKNKTFESRLAGAEKMSKDVLFLKLTSNMTTAAKIFTKMQYTQTNKKPSGRRFSLEEKVLCLSLFKKSPRTYPLLSKYFTLPSTKSLKRLLAKIEVESGLNKFILKKIRNTVKDLSFEDKLCSLIFDEMSISPQIHYNAAKDQLKGFTFEGKKIADHVLVFMVKGLKKKFKQPVAYFFTNSLKKTQLKQILQKVIKYVSSMGLKIICSICDQSTVNVGAINDLIEETRIKYLREKKEWRNEIIEVGKAKIIPLFDVPHLLKGLRNNLLTKDLKYFDFDDKCYKTIKWEYYRQIYEADKSYGELKCLYKLTDEHIYLDKIKKMRVKTAAQIFSHSVAVTTGHLVARGDVPNECQNLVKFTKLVDHLFDSLNSNSFNVPDGKIYKACVRRGSPHHELWINAIKVFKTVTFIKKIHDNNNKIRTIETTAIPSIKNFIRTIEGIQQIWLTLSQNYLFDAILTRNFNQDPLENFFGNVRSYGARNTSPDSVAFEGAYKSLLINNFNSPHSLHANCEKDDNSCLQSLDFFLTDSVQPCTSYFNDIVDEEPQFPESGKDEIVVPFINLNNDTQDIGQGNYVCGWVLGKCLKNISKSCKTCRKNMYGDPESEANKFIRAKEYRKDKKSLLYPNKQIETCFCQLQNVVTAILKKETPIKNLKQRIKIFTNIFVDYPFNCQTHQNNLKEYFENIIINVLVYSWCRSINRILSGKIIYHGDDETKLAAQEYRNKHKTNVQNK